jgi:hypothetical protein
MRVSIRLLLWLFAGTATLFAVLAALLFLVDVNSYRDRIEQHVSTAFGRSVVLEGPLSLEPSLTPRFVVNGLKIANPDWASRPYLAKVDKFDIRVSLLPLLKGELQVVALELHGVDLLLEKTADGVNNFTFRQADGPGGLPVIERMSLYDATIAFAPAEGPLRRLHFEQVTARNVPGQPVELEAHTAVNAVPVTLSLRGEPLDDRLLPGPWRLTLLGEAGETSLRVEGRVAGLTDWSQGEYQLNLQGWRLGELETLFGYSLPEAGPFQLATNIDFKLKEYLSVSNLSGRIGSSDMRGDLRWDFGAPRPAIKARLHSQQLNAAELGIGDPLTGNTAPASIAVPGNIDLDVAMQVQRLDGLAKPVQDIALAVQADRQRLRIAVVQATMNDTHITAKATLPWGDLLTTLVPEAASLKTLLQHAELDIQAQSPDAAYRYATRLMGRPLELTLSSVAATARPGTPLTIRAEAALNSQPVTVNLKGETLAALLERPGGPWRELTLGAQGDGIQLNASGSVARPFEAEGFDVRYAMRGADIAALLPLQGAWSLTGRYTDKPDHSVFDKLELRVGKSDIGGRVAVYQDRKRNRLVARLNARRIDLAQLLPDRSGGTPAAGVWDQPLDIGGLADHDLDVELRIQDLQGVDKSVQDIRLDARADADTLILEPLQATLDGTQLEGRVQLPWGGRLDVQADTAISMQNLVQLADLKLKARPPEGKLQHRTSLMGHPFDVELTGLEASARPGKALQISATALLDDTPVQADLRAQPLAVILQRPTGPWEDLALGVRIDDIRFAATGSVARPLEASGFDIRYALHGSEVDTLLPLFNLILPLEGAYSLTGHFADQPGRLVFDAVKIKSGSNDIRGDISVYQDKQRPKVVANLQSEQIYLSKLLPVSETDTPPDAQPHVIPDYTLPIERMRELDGELTFKGKRLRTSAGDLGDISFKATLRDGVFRLEPFEVRGWAGSRIESDLTIDASQEPPRMNLQWIARQLNYGVLLEQAGLAETAKGTIDVTLRLSGTGRTRREFLGDADGQLIVVGQEGIFGSRRLDLWGSDLVSTMLSRQWRSEDVTGLNCIVARIGIDDGVASSDAFIVDTQRITIAATGTLDLATEALNLVIAPRPKRTALLSLANPARVTGTLAEPQVAATVLPRNRVAAGTGLLAGLVNPAYVVFTFSQVGSGARNPCAAAVEEAMALKGRRDEITPIPAEAPARFSLLPGCTRSARRPAQ